VIDWTTDHGTTTEYGLRTTDHGLRTTSGVSVSYTSKGRENQIAIALARCATSVKRADDSRWEFSLANGKPLGVSACLIEDWLVFDALITNRITRGAWWDLLRLNAAVDGLSKFVLTPDEDSQNLHLRAEIPLQEDEDSGDECANKTDGGLTTRVLETCAGLKAAFRSFRGESFVEHQVPASFETLEGRDPKPAEELRRLCGDSGWRFIERSEGRLMIELDVRRGFYQAAVEQRPAGAEIVVEIASSDALTETSRQALSLLLLGTGALVKLARPSIVQTGEQVSIRFEVKFVSTPTAAELAHAFSSLSVACALSGQEARVLQDEATARDYLAILGAQTSISASYASD